MNRVHKRRIVIEYWAWEPFEKQVKADEDQILMLFKERKILSHAGYPKIRFEEHIEGATNEQA